MDNADKRSSEQEPIDKEFKEILIDPSPSSSSTTPVTATATKSSKRIITPKTKPFVLGGRFFLLDWLYLWVFPLIHRCREQKSIKKILLQLANVLTAKKNGEDLDVKWAQEKASAASESR